MRVFDLRGARIAPDVRRALERAEAEVRQRRALGDQVSLADWDAVLEQTARENAARQQLGLNVPAARRRRDRAQPTVIGTILILQALTLAAVIRGWR